MTTNHKIIIGDSREMKEVTEQSIHLTNYKCKHCRGEVNIGILRNTEKATVPPIEFCPFCGMSNFYPKESEKP